MLTQQTPLPFLREPRSPGAPRLPQGCPRAGTTPRSPDTPVRRTQHTLLLSEWQKNLSSQAGAPDPQPSPSGEGVQGDPNTCSALPHWTPLPSLSRGGEARCPGSPRALSPICSLNGEGRTHVSGAPSAAPPALPPHLKENPGVLVWGDRGGLPSPGRPEPVLAGGCYISHDITC